MTAPLLDSLTRKELVILGKKLDKASYYRDQNSGNPMWEELYEVWKEVTDTYTYKILESSGNNPVYKKNAQEIKERLSK